MKNLFLCSIMIFGTLVYHASAEETPIQANVCKHDTCEKFSRRGTYTEEQVIGTWYMLRCFNGQASAKDSGCRDLECLTLSHIKNEELTELAERLGKFLGNVTWDAVSLNMVIPCLTNVVPTRYYLEKEKTSTERVGSYVTLPHSSPKEQLTGVFDEGLSRIRMKVVNEYLVVLDCAERFTFLLGRRPLKGRPGPTLQTMIYDVERFNRPFIPSWF